MDKLETAKTLLQEWTDKQGHDRCWYYPDIFNKLCEVLEIKQNKKPELPSICEFQKGCEKYTLEQYKENPGRRLFVPALGSMLILSEDWTFKLFFESRNSGLIKELYEGDNKKNYYWADDFKDDPRFRIMKAIDEEQLENTYSSFRATNSCDQPYLEVTFPKNVTLIVDRIYIKRGGEAFNSITFRTGKFKDNKKISKKRFWAKLQDVNKIVANFI